MEKILDIITAKMQQAFVDAGYDASFGRVRPDLCEYPCNGALAAAKQYKCAPIQIAKAVAEKLDANDYSEDVKAGHIALIGLAKNILETCIHILGFSAPEKM